MNCARQAVVERLRAAGCVFAEDEAELLTAETGDDARLADLVELRARGVPLEQLLGWALFCGRRMAVEPGVFVPRRRTEFLVACAIAVCGAPAVFVELCCGCGAVGAAVAASVPGVELHAVDIDPVAVRCARHNLGVAGAVYEGDLYAPLPAGLRGAVDVLVANAPYVPSGEMAYLPPEARDHEPRIALDGGMDGLDVHRRIAAAAPEWLARGGSVLIETSRQQAPTTAAILRAAGLEPRVQRSDDLDATVAIGYLPPTTRRTSR